jgi:hypothetical protein
VIGDLSNVGAGPDRAKLPDRGSCGRPCHSQWRSKGSRCKESNAGDRKLTLGVYLEGTTEDMDESAVGMRRGV